MNNLNNNGKKRLNLGCGVDYRGGWINLDDQDNEKKRPDVIHDLNKFPYPFKDNSFDYVLASHVLEHLDFPLEALKELWRICKPGAIIQIKVPYFTSWIAWGDITHKRPFTYNTFSIFCGRTIKGEKASVGYIPILFDYKSRRLVWGTSNHPLLKHVAGFMNWLVNLKPEFVERRCPYIIPIEALHAELIVKK